MDESHLEVRLDHFQLCSHLNTNSASTNDHDAVLSIMDRGDVVLGFKEILLSCLGLRHDGPDAAQTGSGDEVVVLKGALLLGEVSRDGSFLGCRVDTGDGALDDVDAGVLEARDIRVLDPVLLGEVGISKSQRGADQMVCDTVRVRHLSYRLAQLNCGVLTVAIPLIDNSDIDVEARKIRMADVWLRVHAGRVSLAQIKQVDSSR